MKHDDLRRLFPNASPDLCSRNTRTATKLERNPRDGALGKRQAQKQPRQRFLVRVTSIRSRLIDEDNLCEKYHIDLCRYASGGAFGDEAETTRIETTQRKAEKGEQERTLIEIFTIN